MSGSDDNGLFVVPAGHTVFEIGNEQIAVPPISFWVGETLEAEMGKITLDIKHNDYVNVVLKIIATCIEAAKVGPDGDPDPETVRQVVTRLKRRLSIPESMAFYDRLTELYSNSGFMIPETVMPPETATQVGQPTESLQTSLFEESVAATPTGSNVH